MAKITKEMTLHQAIKANPGSATVFDSYGMGCKSCSGGSLESIEWGANMHGVDPNQLVKELNGPTQKPKKRDK
jgi:hybrid cluster-associated redox disulfide protein